MTSDADYRVNPADRSYEVPKMVSSTDRRRRRSAGKRRRQGPPAETAAPEPAEPVEDHRPAGDDLDDPHDVDYYA